MGSGYPSGINLILCMAKNNNNCLIPAPGIQNTKILTQSIVMKFNNGTRHLEYKLLNKYYFISLALFSLLKGLQDRASS